MSIGSRSARVNGAAVAVTVITVTVAVVYVLIIRSQGDSPLPWVLAVLGTIAGFAAYASRNEAAYGPAAIATAGMLLFVIGVLGMFSIGLPLLVAGVIATVSAWRRLPRR